LKQVFQREQRKIDGGACEVEVATNAVRVATAHRREVRERLTDMNNDEHDETSCADRLQKSVNCPFSRAAAPYAASVAR
jgi:hypothetical protein